uniref:HAT C-terminal dimerisation domain-containing protein n=1 Tax=Setaria viridis TaxID=4556 RepID=A0A4U6SUG6_SETVI|nr:hypothetical protein SEVIR_9G113700v2 [Setaria viridis]
MPVARAILFLFRVRERLPKLSHLHLLMGRAGFGAMQQKRRLGDHGRRGPNSRYLQKPPQTLQSCPALLQVTLPDGFMLAPEILLQFITTIDCYSNGSIAYRILHATIASAEKSFSKLKILKKNYLRSTVLQQRMDGLAMCSIEKDILRNIDL